MTQSVDDYLRQAEDSLAAAELLLSEDFAGYAAARAYYGMFYVAQAFLATRGLTSRSSISLGNLLPTRKALAPPAAGGQAPQTPASESSNQQSGARNNGGSGTETDIVEGVVRRVDVADRHAREPLIVAPRPAAQHAATLGLVIP